MSCQIPKIISVQALQSVNANPFVQTVNLGSAKYRMIAIGAGSFRDACTIEQSGRRYRCAIGAPAMGTTFTGTMNIIMDPPLVNYTQADGVSANLAEIQIEKWPLVLECWERIEGAFVPDRLTPIRQPTYSQSAGSNAFVAFDYIPAWGRQRALFMFSEIGAEQGTIRLDGLVQQNLDGGAFDWYNLWESTIGASAELVRVQAFDSTGGLPPIMRLRMKDDAAPVGFALRVSWEVV